MLLALVLLIPVTSLAVVTGSSAISSWSVRQATVKVRASIAAPSALMAARALIVSEGLPSVALANAAEAGVSVPRLSRLSGVDFPAARRAARPKVDDNETLREYPVLVADLARLRQLRPQIDAGRAGYRTVLSFFTGLTADIDAIWKRQLDNLRNDVTASPGTGALAERISVLPSLYAVLTTTVRRAAGVNNVIRSRGRAAALQQLIEANGAYQADSNVVAGQLGPRAAAAWQAMERDPAVPKFANVITQTVDLALAGRPSPLASNLAAHAQTFAFGARWLDDLQTVVQGAAADVISLAHSEEAAATQSFQLAVAIFLLSLLFAAGAAVLLIRSVVRPLRRLSDAAREVAEGKFTLAAVAPTGPREVTETIAAVDELTAVLAAVESFTVTLAEDPTAASLDDPLPGRTGLALQTTLDRLRESVREAERQRVTLQRVATHDGHTGLLNRTAALEAVTRELSRARRDKGAVMLLFIDLDGLKSINDTHGHKAGDEAIKLAAHALSAAARTSDVVARLGGDEFLVAGSWGEGRGDLESLAERIHRAVGESTLKTEHGSLPLQCSIGVATSLPGDNVESLIHQADEALYEAKRQGRNQISWRHGAAVPAQRLPV